MSILNIKNAIFTLLSLATVYSNVLFAQESGPVKVIEPKEKPKPAKPAMIDSEKIQLGLYSGFVAVEDFSTNYLNGLSLTYLLSDKYAVFLNYGASDVGRSTYEISQSEGEGDEVNFLSKSQRQFSYITLSGAYKLFTSRSFLGANHKFDSDIYMVAGLGTMKYAGASNTGISLGSSYRVVLTDWMVMSFDFRDHIFNAKDVYHAGEERTRLTHNIEFNVGLNALF